MTERTKFRLAWAGVLAGLLAIGVLSSLAAHALAHWIGWWL